MTRTKINQLEMEMSAIASMIALNPLFIVSEKLQKKMHNIVRDYTTAQANYERALIKLVGRYRK